MITIDLVPKEVVSVQTKLHYNIIGIDSDGQSFNVHYRLTEDDGWLIDEGNKTLPIEALAVITSGTTDITALNTILAGFGIQAQELNT
jgi:hypothetical protein